MPKYYDWEKTFSYDADVTMVVGARGVGKTFGLRKQFIRDFCKDGSRFVEIVRYKNELSGVSDGYFDRLESLPENENYMFRTDTRYAYIADKPEDYEKKVKNGEKVKVNWHVIGYFIAMTDAQRMKKRTFNKVRRIVLDEAIIERNDRYHSYLPNEFNTLANIVDTVSRERADTVSVRPRVYLLGNACDFANPYFGMYGVTSDLKFGYRWFANKTFLLHYVDSGTYAQDKLKGTVAGRMMRGTDEGLVAASNEFMGMGTDFVLKKPKHAKFLFGIHFNGNDFGVWVDNINGRYHVNESIPNNATAVYYLSNADAKVNYIAAKRTSRLFQTFGDAYYMGMLRYETVDVKRKFYEVLQCFGIR